MKVLVCVLSGVERGGWVNPFLAQNLITMARDTRFNVQIEMVIDKHPVDYARNCCIAMARERKQDFLLMIDNDQSFWPGYNPLDLLRIAGRKEVIGLPSMQGFSPEALDTGADPIIPNFRTLEGQHETDAEFFTVTHIGTGVIFINRRVWETVPGPWFKWCYREGSELRETDGMLSEDFYFCDLVRRNGFKVWAHQRVIPHWKTAEVSKLGMFFQTAKQMTAQAHAPMPDKVEWK